MNEIDKRIHLSFFVLLFMNLFYALISNSYLYIFYFIFALIVAYFVVYPDKFFLILNNAEDFAKRFVSSAKKHHSNIPNMVESNDGTNVHNEVENNWKIIEMKTKDRHKKELAKKILKVAGKELITHFIIKGAISLGVPSFVIMMIKVVFEVLG